MAKDYDNIDLFLPSVEERRKGAPSAVLAEVHKKWPQIAFAADAPSFRAWFLRLDDHANTLKALNRLVGVCAVVCGWIALGVTAAAPLYEGSGCAHTLSTGSLTLGVCAAASAQEKYAALVALERAAYEEMKGFLRTNYDARFLL